MATARSPWEALACPAAVLWLSAGSATLFLCPAASGNCLEIFREFGTKVCLTAFIRLPDRGQCTFGTRPGGAFQRLCPRDDAPHLVHFAVAVKDDIDARCKDGRGLCREIPRKRLHGGIVADQ